MNKVIVFFIILLVSCDQQAVTINRTAANTNEYTLSDCKLAIHTEDKWNYENFPGENDVIVISNQNSTINLCIEDLENNSDLESAWLKEKNDATENLEMYKIIEKKDTVIANHKVIVYKTEFIPEGENQSRVNTGVAIVNNGKYIKFIAPVAGEENSKVLMNFVKGITFN